MQKISLDKIKTSNKYLRLNDDVESLTVSINTIGLIHPLVIDGDNELLAGGRRYSALKSLGIKEVDVITSTRSKKEQELISIDENIVRRALTKLEFEKCLNRGREIYEELNPHVHKIILKEEALKNNDVKEEAAEDQNSYAAISASTTGLSKEVITKAIRRDELSSSKLKAARQAGLVSATVTNELCRLNKAEQDMLIPMAHGKTVKEIKELVKTSKESGIDQAVMVAKNIIQPPKEYRDLYIMARKTSKLLSKVLLEELDFQGPLRDRLHQDLSVMATQIEQFQNLFSGSNNYTSSEQTSSEHVELN